MNRPDRVEKKLLRRCLSGDNSAWEEFVDKYRDHISSAIVHTLSYCGIEPAGTLVETLFVGVFDILMEKDFLRLRRFRWKCRLPTWLSMIAVRATLDYLTQHALRMAIDAGDTPDAVVPPSVAARQSESEEPGLRHEEWQIYKELKTRMSSREQLFLNWYYHQEIPLFEVAQLMGISVDAGYQLKDEVRHKMKPYIKQLI